MIQQFFKILTAVILIKITGYGLIVTLLQNKFEVGGVIRSVSAILLVLNFFYVYLSFRKSFYWMLGVFINFLILLGLLH